MAEEVKYLIHIVCESCKSVYTSKWVTENPGTKFITKGLCAICKLAKEYVEAKLEDKKDD